ncbi:cupin domain-containing protein [Sphingobium sp.]|uniref:cupin domain-containing protein n=1 Tax=Sphingobium sp. TaxID=1912891 RepID=UPI0028BEE114|nr:cupin domain-containing protein [Sphingobium sp.]
MTKMIHTPGFVLTPLWATSAEVELGYDGGDAAAADLASLCPGPGESRFLVLTIPPDKVMAAPGFDPVKAMEEQLRAAPGIADRMEPECPGMHRTPTIDYGVVLDGEIWLELDDEETVHLRQFDTFVQYGARHAWRNRGDRAATVAFVLIGAKDGVK